MKNAKYQLYGENALDREILVAGREDLREKLDACLGNQYQVVSVGDAQGLMHVLEHERVDLVILGLCVGEMGAWESIPMISHIRPGMRIVAVAQENTLEKERAVREQGVFYYLVEPFDTEEIAWVVAQAVEE